MTNEYYNNDDPLIEGTLAKATDLNTDRDRLELAFDSLPTLAEVSILSGATVTTAELNLLDGVTATTAEINLLDGVTATTAEINILDGVTATTAELNILDGVTATALELNIMDGVTATTAEINILDGVTASTAEINLVDGITVSTATINLTTHLAGTTENIQNTFASVQDSIDAERAYVDQLVFTAVLPNQTVDTAGNVLKTDGTNASWQPHYPEQTSGLSGSVLQTDGTNVSWQPRFSVNPYMATLDERTANTAISVADKGKLISFTGTFTQTLTSAVTLGDTWGCFIKNAGTGDITIDPDGTETIDGLTSYVIYPGETRLIQCDGTTFFTVILETFYKTFTSSGTFVKPPGYSSFKGLLWGGGASGGSSTGRGGGCGGACFPFGLNEVMFSTTESVVIGAGGGATTGSTGNPGGHSTFNGITAYGGTQSMGGGWLPDGYPRAEDYPSSSRKLTNIAAGGRSGGYTLVPEVTLYGGAGGGNGTSNNNGAASAYGGGGGGGGEIGGSGGVSAFGGNGGAGNSSGGAAGTAPGGGGGGSNNTNLSGAGARGELRIWGII